MTRNFNLKTQRILLEVSALQLTPEENDLVKNALEEYKELKTLMDEVGVTDPNKITRTQAQELSAYKIAGRSVVFKRFSVGGDTFYGIQLSSIKHLDRSKKEGRQNTSALVYVNFAQPLEDLSAVFYEVDKQFGVTQPTIVINDIYVGGKLKDLYALVSHELLHGVQTYKKHSPGYEQAIDDIRNNLEWDRVDYYTDPGELEVQIGEVAGNINHYVENEYRKYQQLNKTEGYPEKGWKAKRDLILLELKNFLSSPPENYFEYKELKIPPYLKRSDEFLETIAGLYGASKETEKGFEKKKWSAPWKRLQAVLFNTYKNLEKKYPVRD